MAFTVKAACTAYGKIDQKAEDKFLLHQWDLITPGGRDVDRVEELDNRTYAGYANESDVSTPDVDLPDDWVAKAVDELG